ncbi:MAG: glycosyltransferase family 39 protein [Pleurocapsa minor GSE-CHR-MK-17-07R]|jgi:hypothetical protein|nr:glycosyltransferase family 39 protein [Pleurocapsa minor GSE-CHR-MK 17-07R]
MNTERPPLRAYLLPVVILLAVALLLTGYYAVHKPIDPASGLRYLGMAIDVLAPLGLTVVCAGAGRGVMRRVAVRAGAPAGFGLSRAESLALDAAIGLGMMSGLLVLVGLAGLFRPLVFAVMLLACIALFRRDIPAWLRDARGIFRASKPDGAFTWVIAGFCVLLLALALIHTLAPPYAWDSIVYHLVEVQHALRDGRLTASADNFYLGFPKATEMLFGMVIGLTGRFTSGGGIHFAFGVLGLLAAAGMARRLAGRQAAWLAVTLLLASFNLWQLFGWEYVDLAVMLFSTVGFGLLLSWRAGGFERHSLLYAALLGVLCGFGFGTKYTMGAFILACVLWMFIAGRRQALRPFLVFGIAATLAYAPHALRGLLLYGNPIYPYFLNGLAWDGIRSAVFSQAGRGLLARGELAELLALPVSATVLGMNYGETYSFTLGPFLLTSPLLLTLLWRVLEQKVRTAAVLGLAIMLPIYIYWAVTAAFTGIGMQTRLVIMLLPISAVLGACALVGLDRLPEKPIKVSFIVRGIFLLTVLFSLFEVHKKVNETHFLEVTLGTMPEQEFLFRNLATHRATLDRLNELPAGSTVRFMWEPRNFYCPAQLTCIPDVLFDNWGYQRRQGVAQAEIISRWRDAGDDYLLFFHLGYQEYLDFSFSPEYDVEFPVYAGENLPVVWAADDGRYTLYALNDAQPVE